MNISEHVHERMHASTMDSIHDKSKFSHIQIDQNFKTQCTGLQRGSEVCAMGTGVTEFVAKLAEGLRSPHRASKTASRHFAPRGSVRKVAILPGTKYIALTLSESLSLRCRFTLRLRQMKAESGTVPLSVAKIPE